MEYKNYIVPKEIKIEDIARQFGLSIAQLKELNPQMRTFTNIWGTETYVSVQQVIKVPSKGNENPYEQGIDFDFTRNQKEKKEKLERYGTLALINEKECRYKITIKQKLYIKDKTFVETETEIDWIVFFQKNESNIVATVTTENNIVKNQPLGMSELVNFSMLFNEPTKVLRLELDETGSISKVLNQGEIFQKWLKLRNNNLEKYHDDVSMKGILVAGDTEYSNTLYSLIDNPLYFLFFDKVYNKVIEKRTYYNSEKKIYSKLFQGVQIPIANKQHFKLEQNLSIENVFFSILKDEKEIKDFFMINYKDLVGSDWDYFYKIQSSAKYQLESGALKTLDAKCIEQANQNLFHETIYNIKLID